MKKLNKVMDLSFNIIFVSLFFCWSSHLLLKLDCILKSKNYHDNLLYGISTKYSLSGKFSFCSNFHVHLKYCHILYVIENFLDHKKITCVNYKDACTVNWVLICVCVCTLGHQGLPTVPHQPTGRDGASCLPWGGEARDRQSEGC